jgi:hypothetical protein
LGVNVTRPAAFHFLFSRRDRGSKVAEGSN